jgi:hypothetical protein
MGLVATVAERLGLAVLQRGRLELLDLSAARQLIQACPQERAAVVGIEGFRVTAERTVPEMEAIADFSEIADLAWPDRVTRSVAEAQAFLDEINDPDLWFELELVQEEGEAV